MSSINIENDIKRQKMRYLLSLLSLGKLTKELAGELKPLLIEELQKARSQNDIEHQKELSALIQILDSYLLGKVNLMVQPDAIISNVSNV
jgi:hypothetical protein